MPDVKDRVEPKHAPPNAAEAEASAALFLSGIEQAFSDPDEERLLITIRELRAASRTLDTAIRLYESKAENSAFRWGVVYLMSQIGGQGAAAWLTQLALQPLPDAPHSDQRGCQTQGDNEVLVRVMAVEGLGELVESDGTKVVSDALTSILASQTDPAILSAAAIQLVRLEPDGASRLRTLLPSRYGNFADVELKERPTDVDERPDSMGLDPGESTLPPLADEKGR